MAQRIFSFSSPVGNNEMITYIVDTKGNLVAEYSSSIIANDYTVTIYDNDVCSDLSILMIVISAFHTK